MSTLQKTIGKLSPREQVMLRDRKEPLSFPDAATVYHLSEVIADGDADPELQEQARLIMEQKREEISPGDQLLEALRYSFDWRDREALRWTVNQIQDNVNCGYGSKSAEQLGTRIRDAELESSLLQIIDQLQLL